MCRFSVCGTGIEPGAPDVEVWTRAFEAASPFAGILSGNVVDDP